MATNLQLTVSSTFTGQSAIDMTKLKQDIYDVHFVTFELTPNTDNALPSIRYINASDDVITATDYDEAHLELISYGSSFSDFNRTNVDEIRIAENVGNATNESCSGAFYIFNAGNSSSYTFSTHQSSSVFTNGDLLGAKGIAVLKQTEEIKGFRVFDQNNSGGTFDGTISVFGVKA